jgi:prepilin-type N-terminal cleavage/methylation domain-containing protein
VNAAKDNRGFSLFELLIILAVLLILVTIAIPSLLRSRQAANESAAVNNLRVLNTAQVSYSSSSGGVFGSVSDLVTAGLVDGRYQTGVSGYTYAVTLSVNARDYTADATAMSPNTGRYDFYTTPDYVIRYSTVTDRAPVGLAGLPVQN